MKMRIIVAVLIGLAVMFPAVSSVSAQEGPASPQAGRTYATDADFGEGVLTAVEAVENQLKLSEEPVTLSFMWVPNDTGTVSKVCTETGDELGRYRVVPPDVPEDGSPSRAVVDHHGNVWVGLRTAGTVVKIGLCEAGNCIDRNQDGIIQTSLDLDGDGNVTGAEILPWGEDECVLFEVVLVAGHEGTHIPGTYEGPYDTDFWGTSPRSLAVDAENNLWVGTGPPEPRFFYIDGQTGEILDVIDMSPWDHWAYGATIDRNGVIWSVRPLLRIDPSSPEPVRAVDFPYHTYGLTPDYLGHLFVTGGDSNRLYKIDIETDEILFAKDTPEGCARGVAVTPGDNHVWVADSCRDSVLRYDNEGNLIGEIEGFNYPSGVSVDAAGKVWVSDMASAYIHRIDPDTDTVDLSKRLIGTWGHYSYGAMTTGVVSTTRTAKIGTWTVVHDSSQGVTPWGTIIWTGDEPEGTHIGTEVRSSPDRSDWSAWETAEHGVPLTDTPDGRYLEIRVTLEITEGDRSPVLYDLTVEPAEPVRRCFIATAAYGSPMAREVQTLREFRDGYLSTNAPGKFVAGFYYRVSPPMAELIDAHPALKPIVWVALMPAVSMSTLVVNTTPAEKTAMVGLLVLLSATLSVWATRRGWRARQYC